MIGLDTITKGDQVERFGLPNAGVQEGDDYNQIRYSFDVSRVTPVVGEVRPVNRAVRYLIRAR